MTLLRWLIGLALLTGAVASGINEAFFAKHQCEDCVGWNREK